MPRTEEQQSLQFVITIVNVKMKVKFPCKMVIEQPGCVLTKQTQPSEGGKFIFNQELRLKQDTDKLFSELSVCLITEKGARYTAGSIRLYHNEVLNSEGERFVVTLSKCLDPEALCEIRIDKVLKRGTQRKRTLTSIPEHQKTSSPRLNEEDTMSPRDYKTNKIDHLPINESKSEAYLPASSNNIAQRKGQFQNKPKDYLPLPINTPIIKRFGNPSPRARRETINSKSKYQPFQSQVDLQRQKAIESDVYKDNYLKLKQKYQREAEHSKNEMSRRMMLENNENNLKLEIMRYKIKNDELEKSLAERAAKVKELTAALSAHQGKDSEISYLREDISAKQHTMRMLEETIVALTRENDQLRVANKETVYKFQQKIIHLEGDIDALTSRSTSKQQELEKEMKMLSETLAFKQVELARKNEQLQKENKSINDLQKALQSKLFECDSLLQAERNNSKQRAEQGNTKLEQCNQAILRLKQQKNDIEGERQKLKAIILRNQYEIRLYQQEASSLKSELEELKAVKDKYTELSKEMKTITEQNSVLSKNHERILLSKESSIEEIAAQYRKEVQYQKRVAKDLEEKNKALTSKLIETEGQLELAKGSLEKLKRSHQTLNKDYAELKQKEKTIKRSLKSKEEQCEDAKKEMQRIKEKQQSINDSVKAENSKQRQQIAGLKKQLELEATKNDDLAASNGDLTMELARIKMTLQLSQEKYEKFTNSIQQRYAQLQRAIKQHEAVNDLLQEKIKNQKSSEKQYFAKIQKNDQEICMITEKNEKARKELRSLEEKNKQLETNFKGKQSQLTESLRRINDLESKNNILQDKEARLKESLQSSKNQLEKSQKIIDILQKDYQRAKSQILSYSLRLGQRQRQIDQQAQVMRKEREAMANLENKLLSAKKELEKFKESVAEALNNSFVQATNSFAMEKNESYKASSSIQRANSKASAMRGNADFSNELANLISQAGKQNSGQISKLNDRVKQLERDLQTEKAELERTSQESKRQKQQASHTIKQLEDELILLRDEKGEGEAQLQSQIYELQSQIRHLSKECEDLQENKTELEDTFYSLKAEMESTSEDLIKKMRQHKRECGEYEERLQQQRHNYEIAEKKIHDLQAKVKDAEAALMMQKAFSSKRQQRGEELEKEKDKWAKQAEVLKKQVKHLEERYYQLQIQLLTTNEIKQKYENMLCQEESKLKEVRFFNSNILKEKEEIIRKELSLNIEITNLQNVVTELQHKLQQEESSKNKYKADYAETKEQVRKLSQQNKELEGAIASEKQKYNDIRDRIRQKQAILNEAREETLSLQKKIQDSTLKNKNMIEQLRQENDMLSRQLETITIQSNETARTLEGKLAKANQQLQTAKEEMGELQESIFVERENNHAMVESINKLKAEVEEHKSKMEEVEQNYKQLIEENKEKDEYMFEMGGKMYELENRLKEADEEKLREIEELNTSLNVKYDEDYQQIYQKVEFIEKERQYFKQKCQEKDEVIAKKSEELRQKAAEQAEIRKNHDSKVKKLEDEKITIFSDKNKEIAKFVDENKAQFETIRAKQAEIRKVVHQLEISRTTIQKLQTKIKQMHTEKSNQLKTLQSEMESLRKKELTFKSYKDLIRTNQWNCERQVRKIIQNFIKKMLQLSDKQARNDNVISLIKGVEEGLLTMISAIMKE